VNKELSVKYNELVDKAPELIKTLPWGKDFEVDVFRRPDFTALEIVNFTTGGELKPISIIHNSVPHPLFSMGVV
jgi:Peptidase family M49